MKFNLRGKFLLPTLVLVILGLGITTTISYKSSAGALSEAVTQQIELLTDATSKQVSSWSGERVREIKNWSGSEIFKKALLEGFMGKAARKGAHAALEQIQKESPLYEVINLVNKQGDVVSSSDPDMIGTQLSSNDYFKESMNGNHHLTKVFKSNRTSNPVFVISSPVFKGKDVAGVISANVNLSAFTGQFIDPIKIGHTGYAYAYQSDGLVFAHPKKDKILELNITDFDFGMKMIAQGSGILTYTYEGVEKIVAFHKDEYTHWTVAVGLPTNEFYASAKRIGYISAGLALLLVVILSVTMILLIGRMVTRPLNKAVEMADAVAAGNLSQRLSYSSSDEVGRLANSLDTMADNLEAKVKLAESIADGDLSQDVTLASNEDALGLALKKMTADLNEILSQVNGAAVQVAAGTGQISDSSNSLSQGATEQAASLEEITSSMTELGAQTKTNAENAAQANQLAQSAQTSAEQGNNQMQDMISAMKEINDSSKEIAKIIKTIDDIAFQTNLLALNAAVEAARAGKSGKGFAVVAQEVRNLAARSAKAAEETTQLIDSSVKKVENGTQIANRTNEALEEISGGVTKVADLLGEIAAASNEQAQGITQINQGLTQIDSVTQNNTANAEETASAAEELSSQALELRQLLTRFELKGQKQLTDQEAVPKNRLLEGKPETGTVDIVTPNQVISASNVSSLDDAEFGEF